MSADTVYYALKKLQVLGRGLVIACFYDVYLAVIKADLIAQSVEFTHEMLVILLYKRTGLAGEDHGHLDFLTALR